MTNVPSTGGTHAANKDGERNIWRLGPVKDVEESEKGHVTEKSGKYSENAAYVEVRDADSVSCSVFFEQERSNDVSADDKKELHAEGAYAFCYSVEGEVGAIEKVVDNDHECADAAPEIDDVVAVGASRGERKKSEQVDGWLKWHKGEGQKNGAVSVCRMQGILPMPRLSSAVVEER